MASPEWNRYAGALPSIAAAVGRTPLVRLNRVTAGVTPAIDTGQRYFTTPLCCEEKHVDIPEREHPLDPYTVDQLDRYQKTWEIIG